MIEGGIAALAVAGAAGFLAGAMNAMAGGGSFVTFPALLLVGLGSVEANASSTVALWPGALASLWAFRRHIVPVGPVGLKLLIAVSILGGAAGAVLLLATPPGDFDRIVPWLLLLATIALLFGRQIGAALRRRFTVGRGTIIGAQVLLAVYGGYFGGAVGLMMMAVWNLVEEAELKALTPSKMLVVAATNTVAVACFALMGAVVWAPTLVMLAGALAGGYGGAHGLRLMPAWLVRFLIIAVTAGTTLAFFVRAYG